MTATTLHWLHYTTTTTPLRYNYNYSCSTSHYIQQLWVRWPLQPLQPFQQTQLQPPFGQSVNSLCHPWFTTTNVSYRFPILETSATALCGTTGICLSLVWPRQPHSKCRQFSQTLNVGVEFHERYGENHAIQFPFLCIIFVAMYGKLQRSFSLMIGSHQSEL